MSVGLEDEQEPEGEQFITKWVPYAMVNLYIEDGWRIVTGYRPCHHDTYAILMVKP